MVDMHPGVFGASSITPVNHALINFLLFSMSTIEINLCLSLLMRETQVSSFQLTSSAKTASIFARRQHIYDVMRRYTAAESQPSLAFICAIALAATTERLLGNHDISNVHRQALARVYKPGQLVTLTEDDRVMRIVICQNMLGLGLPELSSNCSDLSRRIAAWQRNFRKFQTRCVGLKIQQEHIPEVQAVLEVERYRHANILTTEPLVTNLAGRPLCEIGQALPAIQQRIVSLDDKKLRWYFAGLFIIHETLFLLQDCETATNAYLEELRKTYYLDAATKYTFHATVADLPTLTVLVLTARYIIERYCQTDSPELCAENVDPEAILEFVAMTRLLSADNQNKVVSALASLLSSTTILGMKILDDATLDDLALEMRLASAMEISP
jgi:hypothetical protein